MKKLNVAIIGQGRSGRDIHGAFFRSELNTKYNVVAVVDAMENRRERAAEEYGCPVYATYQELFDIEGIDLVINSTFSHMHSDVSIDLLNHGFNVVCEKPFAKTYEDACRVIKAAKDNGKMVNAFQQTRFAPFYTKIKEIVASGILGELMQVSISYNGFGRRWDWQTSKAYAGGGVRNTGPHPIDMGMEWLGFAEDVTVFSKLGHANTAGDAEDYAKVIMTVPGKPLVDIEISSCDCYSPYNYRILAKNGSLRATLSHIDIRYFDPKTAAPLVQIMEPLEKPDRTPAYCSETLDWKEESFDVTGSAFAVGVQKYYDMIYAHLTEGAAMEVTPEQVLTQLKVIDKIHAQNPAPIF